MRAPEGKAESFVKYSKRHIRMRRKFYHYSLVSDQATSTRFEFTPKLYSYLNSNRRAFYAMHNCSQYQTSYDNACDQYNRRPFCLAT